MSAPMSAIHPPARCSQRSTAGRPTPAGAGRRDGGALAARLCPAPLPSLLPGVLPGVLFAALLLAFLVQPAPAWAGVSDYRVVDAGGVYFGNHRLFSKPGVVLADRVYRAIPEYREILDQGLTDKDVRYHFLMKKASERFGEAVKQAARDLDLDLVAEVGAVRAARNGVAAPPDRTDEVVARLK